MTGGELRSSGRDCDKGSSAPFVSFLDCPRLVSADVEEPRWIRIGNHERHENHERGIRLEKYGRRVRDRTTGIENQGWKNAGCSVRVFCVFRG